MNCINKKKFDTVNYKGKSFILEANDTFLRERKFKNGKPKDQFYALKKDSSFAHGLFKTFYKESGELKSKGYFLNNKEHGCFRSYYRNGKLRLKARFINGKLDTGTIFSKNGKLIREQNYHNDKLNGLTKVYSNGKLFMKRYYKDDTLKKQVEPSGEYLRVQIFNDTAIMASQADDYMDQRFYSKFKKFRKITQDSLLLIKVIDYDTFSKDNRLLHTRHGSYKEYYRTGGLKTIGYYKHGKRSGVWKNFTPSGDLKSKYVYEDGQATDSTIFAN